MRFKLGGFVLIVILLATLTGGWVGDRVRAEGAADNNDLEERLRTFAEAIAIVRDNYADKVDSSDLLESAIRGMLRTLDPHSSYFAASDYTSLQEEQKGEYFGLGILIRPERPGSGRVVIVEPPAPGTPGFKAGLRPGDVISEIQGEPIDDWRYPQEIVPKLKGPKGTSVNITVERPGEPKPMVLDIERDAIPLYTIKFAFFLKPRLGYVRIDKFAESTSAELDKALKRLDAPKLEGLILDLRNNPGGSLRQAIEVADRFLLKNQLIVSTRGRRGTGREFRAPRGRRDEYPMVVLINRHSASASEIVSGALQDHDRALIVGQTSFGKALVQTVYPLRGERGLALTTGRYYTPSNRLIQRPYEEGFYDYYYARQRPSGKDGQAFETDGGRTVFEGGGITPDEKVELRRATRLADLVNRRNLFYQFAGQLIRGEVQSDVTYKYDVEELRDWPQPKRESLMTELKISKRTMELFKGFLQEKDLEITAEDWQESYPLLSNRLQQELFISLFGERDGMRIALQLDNQVQRAIELIPQARTLFEKSQRSGK